MDKKVLEELQKQGASLLLLAESVAKLAESKGTPETTVLVQQGENLAKLAESVSKLAAKEPVVVTGSGQLVESEINVSFERFDETVETFLNYLERLEAYFLMRNVPEPKKVHTFVSLLSPKNFSLLKTLLHPETYAQKSYDDLKEVLRKHLNPTPLVIPSRCTFINRKQHEGESIAQYMSELRKLAANCKYNETMLNTMLRDVFVSGLRSRVILDRLFEEDDIELTRVLQIASAMEKASEGTSEILHPAVAAVNKVKSNAFKKHSGNDRPIKCLKCAQPSHKAPECKAANLFCTWCKMDTHVVEVCFKKRASEKAKGKPKEVKHLSDLDGAVGGTDDYEMGNNQDYEYVYDYRDDDDQVFPTYSIYTAEVDHPPIFVECVLNGTNVRFELDSGSKNTILNLATFKRISPNAKLTTCDSWLQAYNGGKIRPLGTYVYNVQYRGIQKSLEVLVVEETLPVVLGRSWMNALGITFHHINAIQNPTQNAPVGLTTLLHQYSKLFDPRVGTVKKFEVELTLKPDAHPIFRKARPVPFSLRKGVEEELERLVGEGILKKVDTSAWATPVVPVVKPTGAIRLCGDYSSTVNQQVEVTQHPFPGFEEAFSSLQGGEKFTVLDVKSAFLHLPVSEKTSEILTINTHRGLYRPQRLMYGVSPAPAIWQMFIESILGATKCTVVHDDIIITGQDDSEHLTRLQAVFTVLDHYDIRLNQAKCKFFQPVVEFLGYKVDSAGVHKTTEKTDAILKAKRPNCVKEVKAYLGLVSFYGRFFPHLATAARPLYELTRKNTKFVWTQECEESFKNIKTEMVSERVLVHYDPNLPIALAVDASPWGLGAVLSHVIEGKELPIAFASRILTEAERKYSQIDKEALSLKWGIFKFFNYVYGRRFTLITDHQPLLQIFGSRKKLPVLSATRMLHYALQLQIFEFDVKYRKSEHNSNADALSRLPVCSEDLVLESDYTDVYHTAQLSTLPISAKEIGVATSADPELRVIVEDLRQGRSQGEENGKLSLLHNCIFHGSRVYIPQKYRARILEELHLGHVGVVKMKALARSYVYWPGMNADVEMMARNCGDCAAVANNPARTSAYTWEYPGGVWERLHIDHAGPFYGHTYLLIVDAYSKWLEVFPVRSTSSGETITIMSQLFARYGYPKTLVSDNATSFTSYEFNLFLKQKGIKHITSAPFHPASNGQVERYVQTFKQTLRALRLTPGTIQEKLNVFLFSYRRAPHSTTAESPAKLMLGRELRSNLDILKPDLQDKTQSNSNHSPPEAIVFQNGERVAFRVYNSPNKKWEIGQVVSQDGLLHYTVENRGSLVRRHVDQLRRVGQEVQRSRPDLEPVLLRNIQQENSGLDSDAWASRTADAVMPDPVSETRPPAIQQEESRKPEPRRSTAANEELQRAAVRKSIVGRPSIGKPVGGSPQPNVSNETTQVQRPQRIRKAPNRLTYGME